MRAAIILAMLFCLGAYPAQAEWLGGKLVEHNHVVALQMQGRVDASNFLNCGAAWYTYFQSHMSAEAWANRNNTQIPLRDIVIKMCLPRRWIKK